MLVHQILKSKSTDGVVTIESTKSVADAAAMLSEMRIGSLVVSDDQTHALGILSERDIVRELGRRGPGCMADKVSDLMTAKLVTCSPEASAKEVLSKMTDGRFRHMPVLDDKGALLGLVTLGDVVKARLSEVSMEKKALEGMIMGF